jgi:hypothetical protein
MDFALIQPVIFAAPSKGWKSLTDRVAAAKAKPGTLNFASAGLGSASHGPPSGCGSRPASTSSTFRSSAVFIGAIEGARNAFGEPRDWEGHFADSPFQPSSETARASSKPRKCPRIAGILSETWKGRFGLEPRANC